MANEQKEFSKTQAAVLGAFAADAYGMQFEWVYDVTQIKHPLPAGLGDAGSKFLNGKKAGDFDMYGDQMMATLRSLAAVKRFDAADYAKKFQAVFDDSYVGWKPSVVKHTLAELAKGTALDHVGSSDHDDNNAFGQNVPLLLAYNDKAAFVAAAQEHTRITFRGPRSLKLANFFSHVLWAVKEGQSPTDAIKAVIHADPFKGDKHVEDLVHKGLASAARETADVVKEFGLPCDSNAGFPIAIHLLAKYENDFHQAIQANGAAGGDSTGRGLIVGALIALHHGSKILPPYTKDIKAYNEIVGLLNSF